MNESTTPMGTDDVTSRISQILAPTPQEEEDTLVTEEETQLEENELEAEYEDDQIEADSVEPPRFRVLNPDTGEEEYYTGEELADGWMRQKTFTQKTQALAEQKKAMEAERAKVAEEREQYQAGLHQYLSQPEPQPPSEELFETDPLAYMKAKDDYRDLLAQRNQAQLEYQRVEGERMRDANLRRQEYLQEQSEKLTNMIPEWRDETVATKEKRGHSRVRDQPGLFSRGDGFHRRRQGHRLDEEESSLRLHDAKGKTKLQRSPEGVATLRPGGQQQPQRRISQYRRAKMQLAKTGKPDDATKAISEILKRSA